MKKLLFILPLLVSTLANAQDVFKAELFSAELVLKHREELELSNNQIDNIKNAYTNDMSVYNSLKWDLDAELVKMEGLLSQIQIDSKLALNQMNKILDLEKDLKLKRLNLMINIKNELTEGQQKKLQEIKSKTSDTSFNFITPINENPRVVLKIDGPEITGQPIYYLIDKDGRRKVESLDNIDSNDIKSINVIKGAAAKKEYGEEGKNGVIIIYLKKSK